jgi:V-type H+-transporting ATPase subunit E
VRIGTKLLDKEFTTKMDNLQINQKIATSAKTNETRIKRMACRNDHLELLKGEIKHRIISDLTPTSDLYKKTVKQLIVQGMIRLLEADVEVKVRKSEVDLVQGMLADCEKQYASVMKTETGRDYATKLSVCKDKFMTEEEGSDYGGVVLMAHGRRIVVSNTLLDRMNLVFEMALPQIRSMLFPA